MTARDALDGIKARLAGATPGPWEFDGDTVCQKSGNYAEVIPTTVNCMSYCYGGSVQRPETPDAEFIAAAPMDVARLVGAVEAVLGLAGDWEANYGSGSKAEQVLGKQKVSIDFAVGHIRAAIENALKEGQ